jgi:hypothetical protein
LFHSALRRLFLFQQCNNPGDSFHVNLRIIVQITSCYRVDFI